MPWVNLQLPLHEMLRITAIEIEGLFRQYHHRIVLNQHDRVTVLHGRNGVGKTATLKLVARLFAAGPWIKDRMQLYPFKQIRIEFSDHSYVEVLGLPEVQESGSKKVHFSIAGSPALTVDFSLGIDPPLPQRQGAQGALGDFDKLLSRVRVHYVDAQRLFYLQDLGDGSPRMAATVESMAADVAARVQWTNALYKDTSTRLDNSLPARLFAPPSEGDEVPRDELDRRFAELERERGRLRVLGLIAEGTSFNPSSLNAVQRAMFATFLRIEEEKLSVFKDFADRAEILLNTMNRKLAPKRIALNPKSGYTVETHDGQALSLESLSSGEQHELVLLHTLLFKVEPGSLLLIDEPELSLHVTWQVDFLAELIAIAKLVGFDAVVATHSPYIVGERRDLMVQLGAPA